MSKEYELIEKNSLKNVQKFLSNIIKEEKIEHPNKLYKEYLDISEYKKKKKYKTQIEEFDMYTLKRIPHQIYIFYYDTNGYIYHRKDKEKKLTMIAYYDRNKKIMSFQGKIHSTLDKFIQKSFNQN